jgi:hypothetical protein
MTEFDLISCLDREERIKESGIREVFTPHKPINKIEFFFGRQKEVQKIIEQLNTPGQHSLLYGERGVGKSSLANVASTLLLSALLNGKLYYCRCDSSTNFESIIRDALRDVGVDINIEQIDSTSTSDKKLGLKVPFASGEFSKVNEISETRKGHSGNLSPSISAEILGNLRGLQVIDEADRLTNPEDKLKLAEFIKLLSDKGAEFKVLIVGVAETGGELIENHESISRCMRETRLGRMSDTELEQIIKEGSKKANLTFDDSVKNKIVKLSAGYPHFTHLLALKCAEDAIAGDYTKIQLKHLKKAMDNAVEDSEGTLKRMYDGAVRSSSTEMYRNILKAAASLNKTEFSAKELRNATNAQTGNDNSQQSLTNYYKKLVSDGNSTILRRTGKGVYRFNDPRMPSYIKIATEEF